jgi:hypothetical protein
VLDIVIGELAELAVVDADDLCFLAGAQRQTGDQVHEEEDDAGAEEGVGEAGDGVRQLVAELDVVAVEPAAGDHGEAVEVGDVVSVGEMLGHIWWDMERRSKRAGGYALGVKPMVRL